MANPANINNYSQQHQVPPRHHLDDHALAVVGGAQSSWSLAAAIITLPTISAPMANPANINNYSQQHQVPPRHHLDDHALAVVGGAQTSWSLAAAIITLPTISAPMANPANINNYSQQHQVPPR